MIARIVIGIILGYCLVAYFPLIIHNIAYLTWFILAVVAFFSLRAAPVLAEPLGYGLLVVLVCYITYLLLYRRGKIKEIATRIKARNITLPAAKIDNHPQLSILLTLVLYTLGLTFCFYLLILLIYVK